MAGEPVYAEHPAFGVPLSEAERRESLRTIAFVPVSHEGHVIGCLNIASQALGEIPASARDALQTVVAQTGNAIARLQAEKVLHHQTEVQQTIFDNIPVMIAFLDREGRHQFVNRCWQSTLGWSLEEAQHKDALAEFYPDLAHRKHVRDYIADNAGTWSDFKTRTRDGRVLDTYGVNVPLSDGSNIGIGMDITERNQAQAALRESAELHRIILRTAMHGFWRADLQGRLLEVNKAYCRMSGYSEQELLAMSIPDLEVAESPAETAAHMQRVAAQGENRFESWHRRKDGSTFPLEISIQYKAIAGGQVVAFLNDITERKQAEKRVQLFSQEIIAAREEDRKQVSSVLHHDVGSLTVGISAHFDEIEQELRSGKPEEALRWMKRTRKLFTESVARLKAVAVGLRPPELDVIGLSAALRQYFSLAPKRGGVRIHFKEALGRRRVVGDAATILFRVAQEALTNAITHGRAKRVDVDIRALKGEIRLTVHDNGREFDPTKQMAQPTSQIGLHVMREMALSAGGVCTVDSGRGKGTTVRLRLPIADCGLRIRGIADLGNPDWGLRIGD